MNIPTVYFQQLRGFTFRRELLTKTFSFQYLWGWPAAVQEKEALNILERQKLDKVIGPALLSWQAEASVLECHADTTQYEPTISALLLHFFLFKL